MSASVKPIDGTSDKKTAMMAVVMSYPRICFPFLLFLKLEIGVSPVAPWNCRYSTRQCMASTGHSWGWMVQTCPIDYPLTPFFWVMNRSLKKSA